MYVPVAHCCWSKFWPELVPGSFQVQDERPTNVLLALIAVTSIDQAGHNAEKLEKKREKTRPKRRDSKRQRTG